MMKSMEVYSLAIKYWLQGDEWAVALEYARVIVGGLKGGSRRIWS